MILSHTRLSSRLGAARLVGAALTAGLLTGLLGSTFHATLDWAQRARNLAAFHVHQSPVAGAMAIVLGTALAAMAARALGRASCLENA
jgi:hypothetical protein